MKKYVILLISVLVLSHTGLAQNGVIPLKTQNSSLKVKQENEADFRLIVNHKAIHSLTVETKSGSFDEISIAGAGYIGKPGTPKLPAYTKLIEVPEGAEIILKVKSYDTNEYTLKEYGINNPVMPVQPSIRKDQDPEKLKFHYRKEAYTAKTFTDYEIVSAKTIGRMRGVRIAKLSIAPVNYNPEKGTIKVYNNIEIEVNFKNADKKLTQDIKRKAYSPYFEPVYSKLINHKSLVDDHPELTKYPVKMLILSDRMFEEALQPYIDWKTKKGFEVIVNYTDEGDNTPEAIKNWVQTHYDSATPEDPAPSFCLLVGDTDQIPASQTGSQSGKDTDLYYFSQDGDYFPEMYYGRFSANNLEQLQPQIDKTLYYEQYQFSDPSFLDDVTLIAGADASWNHNVGQPTVKYGTDNYFNSSFGFANVNDYLDSYAGCYDNERIAVSLINYTAHCSQGSWGEPYFTISDAYNTNNTGKYPLAIGNCCLSADFGYSSECIGEAWVRAENGAVAYIGSSPSSYWFEDFYWAVGAFPIVDNNDGYVPTTEETSMGVYDGIFLSDYTSVGGIIFLGNLAVTEADVEGYPQHINPLYYWEAYNALGDPSLVSYKTQGSDNNVSHAPEIIIGIESFEISAEPGSYAAISNEGILLGAALVGESGTVSVSIDPVLEPADVDIVVTKPQYKPYITTIPATSAEGPYMAVESYTDKIEYNQSTDLNLVLNNIGSDPAANVQVSISSPDANAEITNSNYNYGDIASEEISSVSPAGTFVLNIPNNLKNGYKIPAEIEISDEQNNTWVYTKNIFVQAPNSSSSEAFISNDDNGNLQLDPGENADINFKITNTGDAGANFYTELSVADDPNAYLSLGQTGTEPVFLSPGNSHDFSFSDISAASETPEGTKIELALSVFAGESAQYSSTLSRDIVIGTPPEFLISSQGTHNICTGLFFDSGGPNNDYSDAENYSMTFYPIHSGQMINLSFSELYIEPNDNDCWDKLYVYNGENTAEPLIGTFCGNSVPEILKNISASNPEGALTFLFESDGSVSEAGWQAEISCKNAYALDFVVSDGNNPIENAEIVLSYRITSTDTDGLASFSYVTEGTYNYTVKAEGMQEASGTINLQKDETEYVTLSVLNSNTPESSDFTLVPNPSNGFTQIKTSLQGNFHIRIFNIAGQLVYEEKNTNMHGTFPERIDLRHLGSGIYPIQIQSEGKVYHQKLIIQ
jgi:hypothetical protein